MLKVRIMPTLLYRDFELVKGVGFDSWRGIGSAMQAVRVYNLREVDELVFLDIAAFRDKRSPDFELIDELADECFMPLTVGGGISSLDDVRNLLAVGADKVAVNSQAIRTPQFISEVASKFGSQCVVVSIDARKEDDGNYRVYGHSGTRATDFDPVTLAAKVAKFGAGEILLTSIERDGTMNGYDVELTRQVSRAVNIPVIAAGGAGSYEHLYDVYAQGGASAMAAASMFHFTEQTPLAAKEFLYEKGVPVRM